MDNEIFEDGDPWDHIVNLTMTLEKLIVAHNDIADEYVKLRKKITRLSAQVEELRRLTINDRNGLDDF